jgi:hypothetical protein
MFKKNFSNSLIRVLEVIRVSSIGTASPPQSHGKSRLLELSGKNTTLF